MINVLDFAGADPTGATNSKDAFKAAFAALGDNNELLIPQGNYLVSVTDSDLTDIGFDRDFAFLFRQGATGISIRGVGQVTYRYTGVGRGPLFIALQDCIDPTVTGLRMQGDLVKNENVIHTAAMAGYGVMFYHCEGVRFTGNRFHGIQIPLWITGQPISPARTGDAGRTSIVSGNVFDNYEQVTTYGSGAADLIVSNNIFINAYTAFKVSQNPFVDPSSVGVSRNIIFTNNIIFWTQDSQFGIVSYSTGNSEVPVGFMHEAASQNVIVDGNIIDCSDCRSASLPGITASGPIMILGSPKDSLTQYQTTEIAITNNILIGDKYRSRYAIQSVPDVHQLKIENNPTVIGGISIESPNLSGFTYVGLSIANNGVQWQPGNATAAPGAPVVAPWPAFISIRAGNFKDVSIDDNRLLGDPSATDLSDESLVFLTGLSATDLNVRRNATPRGKISNYGVAGVTATNATIKGNQGRGLDLELTNAATIAVSENTWRTNSTACRLVLDADTKAAAKITFVANEIFGETSGVLAAAVLNLNGGTLRLSTDTYFASGSHPFVLDASVIISSGTYYGGGAPTQQAQFGATYIDYAQALLAVYDKVTASGTSGWKRRRYDSDVVVLTAPGPITTFKSQDITYVYDSAITANATHSFFASPTLGDIVKLVRTSNATGAFNITLGSKTLTGASQSVTFQYTGSAWVEVDFSSL